MKKHLQLTLFLSFIFFMIQSCSNKKNEQIVQKAVSDINIDIPIYNFDELEPLLYKNANKITMINFWAMWCAPCVEELPYLQEYANKNADTELILISQDFVEDVDSKLKEFIVKNNINAKVVLLDDPNANRWIDLVNPNWSGSIPYTIIFDKNNRQYFERSFESLEDLENEINTHFKNK